MKLAGKAALVGLAMLAMGGAAAAQDAYGYYNSSSFDFEGFYAGVYGGARFASGTTFAYGAAVGTNFAITDSFLAGLEVQGGGFTDWSTNGYDLLMLGRGGVEATPEVLVYGALGAGLVNGTGSWAAGGGVEAAAMDSLGVRGEILGTGAWGGGLTATRATVGLMWHMQ